MTVRTPKDIERIEGKMLVHEQAECPVVHTFGPNIYIREVHMPKGALVIGHHQMFYHMNIFLKGKLLMVNDDDTTTELTAPMMFTGAPGRKMGYVLEDVVWLNVYATNEMDVETLEDTYLRKSETWKKAQREMPRVGDNVDYEKALLEFDTTEEEVRVQTEDMEDQTPLPLGSYKIGIFKSNIQGRGVFATADIANGEIIAPAKVGGKRTPVARYGNHSTSPNAKMVFVSGNVYLVSTRDIKGCTGGELGEEVTTNYRENLKLIRGESCQESQQQ